MPTGFRGDKCKKYLLHVEEALLEAAAARSRDPFVNVRWQLIPPPSLPDRSDNEKPPYPPETANIGGYQGLGTQVIS